MGINNLFPLLKEIAPGTFVQVPIDKLSGKRVAIDANNWMFTNMAIARKKIIYKTDVTMHQPDPIEIRKEWFKYAINFIVGWLSYNITPVLVFDGKHPEEKKETKDKRRDSRIEQKAKIDKLYEQAGGDIMQHSGNLIEELRRALSGYVNISSEDFELFKMVMKGIGIPCLQAIGDGEQLCSMLCVDGKVAAVFSADSDNLVYGCPLVINKFSHTYVRDADGAEVAQLECVRIDKALEALDLPFNVFVDLCIMSGCDYNKNMPNYAGKKSLKLLRQYGSIDNLPSNFDTTCLNHIKCRDLFKYVPHNQLVVLEEGEELSLQINKNALANSREYLDMAGISNSIERLVNIYRNITPSSDGHTEINKAGKDYKPQLKLNIISPVKLNISAPAPTPTPTPTFTFAPILTQVLGPVLTPKLTLNIHK